MQETSVLVVGGGFGGFHATKNLLKKGFKVTLISDTDFFTFIPLLPEVATGSLSEKDICLKYSDAFRTDKFSFVQGLVTKIDLENKNLLVNNQSLNFDYLVIATGAKSRVLDPSWEPHTMSLKTLDDAKKIRKAIVAEAKKDEHSTISVIGAGPTGVELIFGARQLLERENEKHKTHLLLFNNSDKLFPFLSDNLRFYIDKLLKSHEINLHANSTIDLVTDSEISTSDKQFKSDITIKAAGVVPNTSMVDSKYLDERGNLKVDSSLKVEGFDKVFALGDIISIKGESIPKLAQTAAEQAKVVADNIEATLEGRSLKKYKFKLKGQLISLGEGRAVGVVGNIFIKGRLVYFLRCMAYLVKVPSFKNRISLLMSWTKSTLKAIGIG